MKKVVFILICFVCILPLFSSEKKSQTKVEKITFVSSYNPSNLQSIHGKSAADFFAADDEQEESGRKSRKKRGPVIDYDRFTPYKKAFLIGAIVCSAIAGTLFITGIVSAALTGYYFTLDQYQDYSLELAKLIGAAVMTGICWGFFLLVFLPIAAGLWVAYGFARKGEKKNRETSLLRQKVAVNPFDLSVRIKL